MADHSKRTQEQSIKARKHELYEADAVIADLRITSTSFRDFVRDTPAAPLSATAKAGLWAVGLIVVALLVLALMRGIGGPNRPTKTVASPNTKASDVMT